MKRAIVGRDQDAAERQAETGAFVGAAERGIGLGEGIHDPIQVRLGDPDPA